MTKQPGRFPLCEHARGVCSVDSSSDEPKSIPQHCLGLKSDRRTDYEREKDCDERDVCVCVTEKETCVCDKER